MKRTLLLALAISVSSIASAQWTFYGLATGADNAFVTDITANGQYAAGSSGLNAFRWTPSGGMQIIPGASMQNGNVHISDDGQRLSGVAFGGDGKRRASYYDMSVGTWNTLEQPDGYTMTGLDSNLNSAWGMSGSGNLIAAAAYDANSRYKPVVYDIANGTHTILPSQAALNTTSHARPNGISGDGSTIVGWDSSTSTRRAAVWKNGTQVLFDAAAAGEANGVSTNGNFVFGFRTNLPTIWDAALAPTTLALPSGFNRGAAASGTDDGRMVVGYAQVGITVSTRRAVIWIDGAPLLLSDWALANGMSLGTYTLTTGLHIAPDGSAISGWGSGEGSTQAGFIMANPVPEPATIGALILGLGALARRRRKN